MTRTVFDWLQRAREATGSADIDHCLDEAAALARHAYDWRSILAMLAELPAVAPQRAAGLADRALEAAKLDRNVAGCCDVATTRADVLRDEAGARQALQAGVETLLAGEHDRDFAPCHASGDDWALLAVGFLCTLGDEPGARRCLDAGLETARRLGNPSDLVSVAGTLDWLGDRPAALAVVAEAEELLTAEPHPGSHDDEDVPFHVWSVANAWHKLGERAAAVRVRSDGTQRARTTQAALFFAKAWHSPDDDCGTERALARAADLAADAADWLELAEVSRATGRAESRVRAALDRAAAVVTDDAVREHIAAGYYRWLGDAAAADRIGPRGAPPDALRVMRRSLPGWRAAPAPLFDWLRARVTTQMLAEIAAADYARDEADLVAALVDICATGLIPRRLPWPLHEVLSLSRWSSGERVDHIERAWCCTLLALNGDELDDLEPGLVDSCLALGDPAPELAEQFLAWICQTDAPAADADATDATMADGTDASSQTDAPLLGLVALLLLRAAQDPADPRVASLTSMALHQTESQPLEFGWAYSVRADLWEELTARILAALRATRPDVGRLINALVRLREQA